MSRTAKLTYDEDCVFLQPKLHAAYSLAETISTVASKSISQQSRTYIANAAISHSYFLRVWQLSSWPVLLLSPCQCIKVCVKTPQIIISCDCKLKIIWTAHEMGRQWNIRLFQLPVVHGSVRFPCRKPCLWQENVVHWKGGILGAAIAASPTAASAAAV